MQLDKAIQERYSCKKFSRKKPNWRKIIECIDATRYSPMAGNHFSLRFILVDNKERIKKLAKASQQNFFEDVSYVLAIVTDPSITENSFENRAERYLRQQAGSAIQNFLLKIQEKGLATCWIGHFVDNKVKSILSIPKESFVEAIFPIGYEAKKPKLKKKINLDNVLYFNTHGNKHLRLPKKLNS
jgi:nitroreductase